MNACQSVLFTLAVSLFGTVALAQPHTEASFEARYQRAADLRDQHQDAQALQVFQEIYSLTHAPRALAQIALAEGALGRWLDADAHLTTALAAPDAWVTERRTVLESAHATMRSHIGELEVLTPTPNAEVWINGHYAGAANRPLRVLAGTTQFEVRAPGRVGLSRVATVPADGLARETVTALEPLRTTAISVTPTPTHGDTPSPGPSNIQRTLGITALVTGGVFLIAGVSVWAYGFTTASDYNNDPTCPAPDTANLPSACQSRLDTLSVAQPLGWAGMLSGAALVITGAVLLKTAPSARRERAISLTGGPGDLGAGLRLTF